MDDHSTGPGSDKEPAPARSVPAAAFEQMYEGQPPWDIGQPQPAFVAVAGRVSGLVLDAGCGTGENSLYFAARGCQVTGIDYLPGPIEKAQQKAAGRNIEATFKQHDALELSALDKQFDCVLDSGLFHCLSDEDRATYINQLASVTHPGSTLFLQCFSEKEPAGDGPRRIGESELREAFNGKWSVESVAACRFLVRDDTELSFSGGGPHALFAVIRRV